MSKSIPSLAATLASLPDPRAARGRRHPWTGLLLLVALGLLAGANTQRALARFGHHLRRPWLRRLGLRQPPSQPTLQRLLSALDVDQLEGIVSRWLADLQAAWSARARRCAAKWLDGIAIDGKTLRGARRLGAADAHLVSAYSTGGPGPAVPGVVLGQVAVDDRTNELGAVGPLLTHLALAGQLRERTVTFDAQFTQWAVATQILQQGGAYLMVVKGNQPTLLRDIAQATALRARCTGHSERVQAGHGSSIGGSRTRCTGCAM
jgi:hypothetical protein